MPCYGKLLTCLHPASAVCMACRTTALSQRAALQLLAGLPHLKSLQLGGAELLLPSTPYYPAAAPPAPTPAPGDNAILGIGLAGQQQGLIAAAVAAVAGGRSDSPRSAATAGAIVAAAHGDHMRSVLAGKANDLATFKLQFNCCGTGVEKVRPSSQAHSAARVTSMIPRSSCGPIFQDQYQYQQLLATAKGVTDPVLLRLSTNQ